MVLRGGSATIRSVSNRFPRRQGVTYGPVRPPGAGRDTGAILGRILGLLVIVLAVGVLGGGAIVFISGRPPTSVPRTSSPIAQVSPTLPSAPTVPPITASPDPSSLLPTPTGPPGSPLPSSEATPFVPLVQVGPGFVTFGTRSGGDLRILDPQSTFRITKRLTWSAYLIEPANSDDLAVRVFKLDPAAAEGERLVREEEVTPSVRGAQIFLRRIRPGQLLDGPGVYVVRYMRGDTVISEGYVLLEE